MIINPLILSGKIHKSEKPFHLIVMYACSPCRMEMPQIISAFSESDSVEVYFVSSDDWLEIPKLKDFCNIQLFYQQSYILDIVKYKHKNHLMLGQKERFTQFTESICKSCTIEGGFPSYILFNNKMEVLYCNSGIGNSLSEIINLVK